MIPEQVARGRFRPIAPGSDIREAERFVEAAADEEHHDRQDRASEETDPATIPPAAPTLG